MVILAHKDFSNNVFLLLQEFIVYVINCLIFYDYDTFFRVVHYFLESVFCFSLWSEIEIRCVVNVGSWTSNADENKQYAIVKNVREFYDEPIAVFFYSNACTYHNYKHKKTSFHLEKSQEKNTAHENILVNLKYLDIEPLRRCLVLLWIFKISDSYDLTKPEKYKRNIQTDSLVFSNVTHFDQHNDPKRIECVKYIYD